MSSIQHCNVISLPKFSVESDTDRYDTHKIINVEWDLNCSLKIVCQDEIVKNYGSESNAIFGFAYKSTFESPIVGFHLNNPFPSPHSQTLPPNIRLIHNSSILTRICHSKFLAKSLQTKHKKIPNYHMNVITSKYFIASLWIAFLLTKQIKH